MLRARGVSFPGNKESPQQNPWNSEDLIIVIGEGKKREGKKEKYLYKTTPQILPKYLTRGQEKEEEGEMAACPWRTFIPEIFTPNTHFP